MVVPRWTIRWYRLPRAPGRSLSALALDDERARRAENVRQARLLDFDLLLY